MPVQPNRPLDRFWDALMKLTVAGMVGLMGWQFAQDVETRNHAERLRVIEETRFTNTDAAILERRIKTELPPEWLRAIVLDLKSGQSDLRDRLARLEALIAAGK